MLFVSDLDNTLIHSYKVAQEEDICVETKDGKELSFMMPKAYALLKEIVDKCIFVPITTRSLEQYRRLDLGINPTYAVVANGALLLIDGQVDEQWTEGTRQMLNVQLPNLDQCELLFDIRYVDEFFIFAKSENPQQAVRELNCVVDKDKFSVCAVHNKVYVFPVELNKGTAMKRLKERLQPDKVICAGDSLLDIPMLEAADTAIALKPLALNNKHSHMLDNEFFALNMLFIVNERLEKML